MNIAFLDSGIGGLSVLGEAVKLLPQANYFYYADTDNAPYGVKDRETVHQLVMRGVDFLTQFDLDALVLACNTATATSAERLRQYYSFPIIGMEPAVKLAAQSQTGKKIVVTATSLTLSAPKLNHLIDSLHIEQQIEKVNLDKLVIFAEQFDFDSAAVHQYLHQQLLAVNPKTHAAVVLGCTHFVFYTAIIQRIVGGNIAVVNGNLGTVKQLIRQIKPNSHTLNQPQFIRFFTSGVENGSLRKSKLLQLIEY